MGYTLSSELFCCFTHLSSLSRRLCQLLFQSASQSTVPTGSRALDLDHPHLFSSGWRFLNDISKSCLTIVHPMFVELWISRHPVVELH
jgi:hypothetical protein